MYQYTTKCKYILKMIQYMLCSKCKLYMQFNVNRDKEKTKNNQHDKNHTCDI